MSLLPCPSDAELVTVTLPIVPVSKPRQTQSDKWRQRPCVMAYRAFADQVRAELARAGLTLPPAGLSVRFDLPMPASWSRARKTRMRGKPHTQKPDLDNCTKALLDAALPADDSGVWHLASLEKRWADVGAIVLSLQPISEARP